MSECVRHSTRKNNNFRKVAELSSIFSDQFGRCDWKVPLVQLVRFISSCISQLSLSLLCPALANPAFSVHGEPCWHSSSSHDQLETASEWSSLAGFLANYVMQWCSVLFLFWTSCGGLHHQSQVFVLGISNILSTAIFKAISWHKQTFMFKKYPFSRLRRLRMLADPLWMFHINTARYICDSQSQL